MYPRAYNDQADKPDDISGTAMENATSNRYTKSPPQFSTPVNGTTYTTGYRVPSQGRYPAYRTENTNGNGYTEAPTQGNTRANNSTPYTTEYNVPYPGSDSLYSIGNTAGNGHIEVSTLANTPANNGHNAIVPSDITYHSGGYVTQGSAIFQCRCDCNHKASFNDRKIPGWARYYTICGYCARRIESGSMECGVVQSNNSQ